jgi:hypothetical protein
VVLALIFIVIVTPVALLRKLIGASPQFNASCKNGATSAWVERNHLFTKEDLKNPY